MSEKNNIKNFESYFNIFIENTNDLITIQNEEMSFEYINEKILHKILGYKREDIITAKDEFKIVHPEDVNKLIEMFKSTLNTGESFGDVRVRHKDGYFKWIQYKGRSFVDKEGKKKIISISRDINEQKEIIEASKKKEEEFRYLYETAPSGLWSARIEDGIFVRLNEKTVKILGFKNINDVINKISAVDFFSIEDRRKFVRDLRLYGEISDLEVILTDINGIEKNISTFAKIYEEKGVIEGVFVDVSTRKRMEESLKESEEKFRTIAEQALMGAFILQDDLMVYANQYLQDLLGYSLEEVRNWKPGEIVNIIHPEDRKFVWEQYSKKKQGLDNATIHYPFRFLKKNGETVWVDLYSKTINYNGRLAVLATIVDITEKVLAEKRLKESEEKFRTIAEQAIMGIFIIQDDLIVYANQYIQDLLGYSFEEVKNWKSREFLNFAHPEDRNLANDQSSKKQQGIDNVITHYQARLLKRNGVIVWVDNYSKTINYNGRLAILATMVDITEKVLAEKRIKESEQKLKDSEENYHSIFNYSPDYIYLTDVKGDLLDINQVLLDKLKIPLEELKGMNWVDFYAGDNLNKIMEISKELRLGKDIKGLQVKAKGPNGINFDIEVNAVPIKEKGNVVKVLNMARDITERRISEQKLRESEEKYKNMIDGLDMGFYQIKWDGTIMNFNPAFRKIMGYDDSIDLSKINSRNFWKKDEDRKNFVKELLKNNHVENFIGLGQNHYGQELYLQIHSHLISDKEDNPIRIEGTIADITEKFKLEQKLKRSEFRYRNIFENSPFGIMLIDTNAIIRDVNPEVINLSGYKREDFIGRSYANLSIVDQEFLPILSERTKKLIMNQPVPPIDIKLYKKDGTPLWVQLLSSTIKIGDETYIQTMVMDITDRKTAEILIKEEIDKLKELDQIRKDLISRVSHELKTPLIPVIGGAELLQHLYKSKFDSESLELIQMIEKGGKRLSKLVEKLLDVTRIEYNKFELDVQKADLSEIIRSSAESMRYLIEKRKIQFNLVIPKEFYLEIDENRIEQVITNLLSNALKNTPADGRVSLVLEKYDNWAILSVSDTGVGFTEEEMKKLFTRFGKIERYEHGLEYIDIEGSGLGLYITKQIVELHGGKIWVESGGRNKGCLFKVRIPIK